MKGPRHTASRCGREKQRKNTTTVPTPSSPRPERSRNSLPFGDHLRTKQKGITRVFCQNPNGLGPTQDSVKMHKLKSFLCKHSPDIVGFPESNLYNPLLPFDAQWDSRVKGWFEHTRTSISFNSKVEAPTRAQKGGTAMLACSEHALRLKNKGFDFRSLGRWNWMQFSGQKNVITRVITVYCCNKKSSPPASNSVYSLQQTALLNHGIFTCPRDQFWIDLSSELSKWIAQGDRIILMGDWNQPISEVERRLAPFHLQEAILDAQGRDKDSAPATHNRGSDVIDGMFHSPSLLVLASGYLAFNNGVGDHRLLWADFLQRSVLGFDLTPLPTIQARRLKLNDPRVKAKYLDLRHAHLSAHNYYERLATLFSISAKTKSSAELDREYECLDKISEWAMLTAEKHCRPLFTGVHEWFPEFTTAMDTISYWTIRVQFLAGLHCDKRKMIRFQKRLCIKYIPLSHASATCHLNDAWITYKKMKKTSHPRHISYRESLAQAQADAGNISKASALRSLNRQEEQRSSSRRVKYALGKTLSSGTSSVIVKDSDGVETEITGKEPMEQAIIPSNEQKYHVTEKVCPILQGKLFEDIGILAEGPAVNRILDGTYTPPPNTPRGTVLYLEAMKRPPYVPPPPIHTVDNFISSWSNAKERTSSGVLHFGHFKAGCSNELLALSQYMMAQIPYRSGYSPLRWRCATDVMLIKRFGEIWVEKLRTIVLYEADFNMNNKRLGREAMRLALSLGLIAPEQYSRPFRSAIDHALNRRLVFDHFRLLKQPFGMCCCDLKGCYDRIVHSAAILALRRIGLPDECLRGMFGTIQKIVHKVRTLFGDSIDTYGGENLKNFLHPIQGVGQGNGAGPQVWAIISSTIFFALREKDCGVRFVSALSKELLHLCGFGYVDDCDMIETGASPLDVEQRMQNTISLWEDMIAATGGVMEPSKSWWYFINFTWNEGRWSYSSPVPTNDLIAHDHDAKAVPLPRLASHEAREMLGVYLAPDGNSNLQLQSMTTKVTKWCTKIRHSNLSKTDLWLAMLTTIFKTLEYPLPALTLTKDQCTSLAWPIIKLVLPKCGISRNISAAVRHGPISSGGLAVPHLYFRSGVSRVRKLVEHSWKRTPTGPLLRTNLEALVLEYGLYGSVFDIDRASANGYLLTPNLWFEETCAFMQENNITLQFPHITLAPRRLNDEALMAGFLRLSLPFADLQSLNRCRLYLQVTSLSDICTGRGDNIDSRWIKEPRASDPLPASSLRSSFNWPQQPSPPSKDWALWKHSISRAWCSSLPFLSRPLGAWLDTVDTFLVDWDWFVSTTGTTLYFRNELSLWFSYHPYSDRSRYRFKASSRSPCHVPPRSSDVYRCSVENRYGAISVSFLDTSIVSPPPTTCITPTFSRLAHITASPDLITTLQNVLQKINDSSWICEWFHCSDSIAHLLVDLVTGKAISVSDGSFYPATRRGSAAWVIASADESEFIKGGGLIPGPPECQSAYRSEVSGLLGLSIGIFALHKVASLHGFYGPVPTTRCPPIVVACDGLAALRQCFDSSIDSAALTWQHFDLITSVLGWWSHIPFSPQSTHVRGHQDSKFAFYYLTFLERLNVDMDYFAKSIVLATENTHRPALHPTFEFGAAIIRHHGVAITSNLETSLYDSLTSRPLIAHWTTRFKLHDLSVDWTSFGNARTNSSRSRQHFVSKWLSGHIGLGKVLARRGHSVFHRCPRCNIADDTALHCLTCPKAKHTFHSRLSILETWLVDQKSHPSLVILLPLVLRSWFRSPSKNRLNEILSTAGYNDHDDIVTLFREQEALGYDRLIFGFLTPRWVQFQDAYYASIGSQRTGLCWTSRLIRQMWEILFIMWEDRNKCKHRLKSSNPADSICPPSRLRRLARVEYLKGHAGLVPFLRSYFHLSEDALIKKSPEDLRLWLHAVICGRERENTTYPSPFLTDRPLRSWLGLRPRPPPEPPP